jgi:hypothetical protein
MTRRRDVHSLPMMLPRPLEIRPWLIVGLLALAAPASRAGENPPPVPLPPPAPAWNRFDFSFETGVTFGIDNPNHYITTPQILTLAWQPKPPEQFFHTPLTFSRQYLVSADAVAIPRGPEDHYFGLGVGVRAILAKPGTPFSVYFDGRFIVGAIDSSGPPAGQGQDLTFSPLVSAGVQYTITHRLKVGIGCIYEHFSNAGFSEPQVKNVGLNTVGPKFEFDYAF